MWQPTSSPHVGRDPVCCLLRNDRLIVLCVLRFPLTHPVRCRGWLPRSGFLMKLVLRRLWIIQHDSTSRQWLVAVEAFRCNFDSWDLNMAAAGPEAARKKSSWVIKTKLPVDFYVSLILFLYFILIASFYKEAVKLEHKSNSVMTRGKIILSVYSLN